MTILMLQVEPRVEQVFTNSTEQDQQAMIDTMSSTILSFSSIHGANSSLYERDFFLWTQTTAELLRTRKAYNIDLEKLAEEIESLGKRDRRELGSQIQRLIMHLLKWYYQPDKRQEGHSWQDTIADARDQIQDILEDSPSLISQCHALLHKHYPRACRDARKETGLPLNTFPQICPWDAAQILDPDFWPAL